LLESRRQLLLKIGAILLQISVMLILKGLDFRQVFILSGLKYIVPVLVKLLVLVKVSVFALLTLLLVVVDHFLHLARVLLLFQFLNTIRSHLSLYVSSFCLTHCSVILHSDTILNVDGYHM